MSGLELVIIVGAGIFIKHKLDERKKRKQQLQQIATQQNTDGTSAIQNQPRPLRNSRTDEQVGSRIRRPNQQVPPEEEEALPLYSPPAKNLPQADQDHPPAYDGSRPNDIPELSAEKPTSSSRTQISEVNDGTNGTGTSSEKTKGSGASRVKFWKRHSVAGASKQSS